MRLKKLDCERNTCSHLDGETRLSCNYRCISEPCYEEIYGHDEVLSPPHRPQNHTNCSPFRSFTRSRVDAGGSPDCASESYCLLDCCCAACVPAKRHDNS
jgi:hypothetical protein